MAGAVVDHLDLVVSDLERSLAFYRELLEPLGSPRLNQIEGERGEPVYYARPPRLSRERVAVRAPELVRRASSCDRCARWSGAATAAAPAR